jgi:hypothetical protein
MSLVNRAKAILLKPEAEWRVIADESTNLGSVFKNYACILAVIPIVAGTIGSMLMSELLQQIVQGAVSPLDVLVDLLLGYLGWLAAVFGVIFIVSLVAPSFNGRQDLAQSGKLVVYAMTATWLASLFLIIPPLGGPAMLAGVAYTVYLVYLGSGPVLGIPADKVAGFTVVFILIFIIVGLLLFLLTAAVSGFDGPVVM